MKRSAIALASLAAVGLGGCDGCAKHKPYVPFEVEAGHGQPSATAEDVGAREGTRIPLIDAGHLEVPQSQLEIEGLTFRAPEGRILTDVAAQRGAHGGTLLAVARDLAGKAPDVALAYAYDARNAGAPVQIAEGPVGPGDERCTQETLVRFSGAASAVLRWRWRCPADVVPEPASVLLVAQVLPQPSVRFRVAYRDPVLELPLEVDADAADLDEDGQDDVRLQVRVEARAPYTQAPAPLEYRWLSRAAGASPVPGAFAESWRALTKSLQSNVEEKSPTIFDATAAGRTLVEALCGPAATVRVEHGGRLEPCDAKALAGTLETLERKALVARNDTLLWASFLSASPSASPEVALLEKGLQKAAPERAFRDARREEAAGEAELPVDAGTPSPDAAADVGALLLRSVEDRCTGSLSAHVELAGGKAVDVTLPLRSERRRGEGSGCTIEPLPQTAYRVLASSPRGLVLLVRGRLVAIDVPEPAPEGDAGAPDAPAARSVFPASEGVAKLLGGSTVALRVGGALVVAQRHVERFVLPREAEPSLAELWPPSACRATEVPAVLRCEHPAGAFYATLPPPVKIGKGGVQPTGAKKVK